MLDMKHIDGSEANDFIKDEIAKSKEIKSEPRARDNESDAVPVVHGHYGFVGRGLQNVQVMLGTCSECNRRIVMYVPTWYECNHYCPNCGAKMDGGAEG